MYEDLKQTIVEIARIMDQKNLVNTYEGKDGKLGTVPMGKLHELYVAVCDWANQWEAFLKG